MDREIQLLLYHIEEQQYALPLAVVERVVHAVEATPLPNIPEGVLGVIDVRGLLELQGEIVGRKTRILHHATR